MNMNRRRTSRRTPLILAVLAEGESWGYAILRRIRALSQGRLDWNEGMLYPVLHRLVEQGLIEGRWDEGDSARRRRYYRITAPGRAALQAEREEFRLVQETLEGLGGGAHA